MKRTTTQIAIALLAGAALLAGSRLRGAAAGPPDPSGSAALPPSASAAAKAAVPRKPPRFLAGFPTGAEPSAKPTPDEWKSALPLELSRPRASCKASRVREYVRITCLQEELHDEIYAARVAAGSEEGVFVLDPKWEPRRPSGKGGIDVVVPVRRGDRRVIVLASSIPRWKSPSPDEGIYAAISESWLAGEEGPTIVIH